MKVDGRAGEKSSLAICKANILTDARDVIAYLTKKKHQEGRFGSRPTNQAG